MKFAKTRDPDTNKSINDETTFHYNVHLTLRVITVSLETMKTVNELPRLDVP